MSKDTLDSQVEKLLLETFFNEWLVRAKVHLNWRKGYHEHTPLLTINKETLTNDAMMLMKSKNIARLPVINDAGEVLGIVSLRNIVGKVSQEDINSISA